MSWFDSLAASSTRFTMAVGALELCVGGGVRLRIDFRVRRQAILQEELACCEDGSASADTCADDFSAVEWGDSEAICEESFGAKRRDGRRCRLMSRRFCATNSIRS